MAKAKDYRLQYKEKITHGCWAERSKRKIRWLPHLGRGVRSIVPSPQSAVVALAGGGDMIAAFPENRPVVVFKYN